MENESFDYDEKLFEDVISFVRNKSRYDCLINQDTSIEDGLGVTGDDAAELIYEFSRRYQINIDEFQFGKYFNDEPNIFRQPRKVSPFNVQDLLFAITIGKLE